jgi:hypothetical protein
VLLLVLAAAILALAAVVAAATFLFLRTRELIREFRAFGEATGAALASVSESGDAVAARVESFGEREAALEPALARLAVARARLSVLLAAVSDVRAAASGVTGLRPRK